MQERADELRNVESGSRGSGGLPNPPPLDRDAWAYGSRLRAVRTARRASALLRTQPGRYREQNLTPHGRRGPGVDRLRSDCHPNGHASPERDRKGSHESTRGDQGRVDQPENDRNAAEQGGIDRGDRDDLRQDAGL